MKKILTVYTGGTICSVANGKMRSLSPKEAPKVLPAVFSQSSSPYAASADLLFEDSAFPEEKMLLSENMTPLAWQTLLDHLGKFSLEDYAGVILLHGTDTLAYTAGLLSFWFAQTPVPFMLVSGNRPPSDPQSNAHANFRTAVELILQDISPNVYVPYRNCDGTLWLHAGARLTQCPECSEDFLPIGAQRISLDENGTALLPALPAQKVVTAWPALSPCKPLSSAGVLVVHPYTGLDCGTSRYLSFGHGMCFEQRLSLFRFSLCRALPTKGDPPVCGPLCAQRRTIRLRTRAFRQQQCHSLAHDSARRLRKGIDSLGLWNPPRGTYSLYAPRCQR